MMFMQIRPRSLNEDCANWTKATSWSSARHLKFVVQESLMEFIVPEIGKTKSYTILHVLMRGLSVLQNILI